MTNPIKIWEAAASGNNHVAAPPALASSPQAPLAEMTTEQEQEPSALAEMEERDLQEDSEETAAEESRGR